MFRVYQRTVEILETPRGVRTSAIARPDTSICRLGFRVESLGLRVELSTCATLLVELRGATEP